MQLTPDYIVIGAGIAGASAAFELAAHGEVVLLERERVAGYHTTGRSAALYTAAWETGAIRDLAVASLSFLEDPPDGFCDYPIMSPIPVLMIGRGDQTYLVRRLYEETAGAAVDAALIDGAEAAHWSPVLRPGYVELAVLELSSRSIDVDVLHQGFLRGTKRRGGSVFLGHSVERIARDGGDWVVVAGDVVARAPVVVNAAGAWCDQVGELAGLRPIGLVPKRRTAFIFPAPTDVDLAGTAMVIDIAEQFYFKPEAGQVLGSLAESTPMEPHDVRPEEIDVARAIARIEAATTMKIRHVRRTWAGLRSFVADELPVVGEDPHAPGFYWLAGQGGVGIMTSPAMAQLVAGLVTSGRVPQTLAARGITADTFAVSRFSSVPAPPLRGEV